MSYYKRPKRKDKLPAFWETIHQLLFRDRQELVFLKELRRPPK